MHLNRHSVGWCFASWVLFSGSARASESFPDVVRQTWGIDDLAVPGMGCQLCHTSEVGSSATLQRPFGLTLLNDYGVTALNVASLRSALREMQPTSDVDDDGVTDYEELVVGTNPNVFDVPDSGQEGGAGSGGAGGAASASPNGTGAVGVQPMNFPMPQTGCAVGTKEPDSAWHWSLLGWTLLLRLRRRTSR